MTRKQWDGCSPSSTKNKEARKAPKSCDAIIARTTNAKRNIQESSKKKEKLPRAAGIQRRFLSKRDALVLRSKCLKSVQQMRMHPNCVAAFYARLADAPRRKTIVDLLVQIQATREQDYQWHNINNANFFSCLVLLDCHRNNSRHRRRRWW